MNYHIIYDGNCNLCVTLVQLLEKIDAGKEFSYVPMQDTQTLAQWQIQTEDCELGIILIDANQPQRRWQGSDAAEEIGRILPLGQLFVDAYRSLPGMKNIGDHIYAQVRDHRYQLFGQRQTTYFSNFCHQGKCQP